MISVVQPEPQRDLFEAAPGPRDPNVAWLEDLLFGAQCWMSARDICLTVQGKLIDRDVREYASLTNKVISGQRGYKHMAHATAEEVRHSSAWLISQGKKMIKRGIGQRTEARRFFREDIEL